MPDIDWSKPVEYERNGDVVPVLHTFELNGVRHVVMNSGLSQPGRELVVREVADLLGTFRNVRRKVKQSRMYWIKRHNDGHISFTLSNDTAYCWRKEGHDVSEHVEEWEADADE